MTVTPIALQERPPLTARASTIRTRVTIHPTTCLPKVCQVSQCCIPHVDYRQRKIVSRSEGVLSDEAIDYCCSTFWKFCCLNIASERQAEVRGMHVFQRYLIDEYGAIAGKAAPHCTMERVGGLPFSLSLEALAASPDPLRLDQAISIEERARELHKRETAIRKAAKHVRYFQLSSELSQSDRKEGKSRESSQAERTFEVRNQSNDVSDELSQKIVELLRQLTAVDPLKDDIFETVLGSINSRLLENAQLRISVSDLIVIIFEQLESCKIPLFQIIDNLPLESPLKDDVKRSFIIIFSKDLMSLGELNKDEIDGLIVNTLQSMHIEFHQPRFVSKNNLSSTEKAQLEPIIKQLKKKDIGDLTGKEIALFYKATKGGHDKTFTRLPASATSMAGIASQVLNSASDSVS